MPSGIIYPDKRILASKIWGWEDVIYNGKHCSKIIFVKNSKKTSFHYHNKKDEVIYVQSGMIELIYNENDEISKSNRILMNAGDAFRIKPKLRHQIFAIQDSYIFESSTHEYDDDSIEIN